MPGPSFPPAGQNAKPLRVVRLTSGSGVFYPIGANSRCRITMVGGGASGGGAGNYTGGGGGATVFMDIRVDGPTAYAIGAGGVGNNVPGGNTIFGAVVCMGGSFSGAGGVAPAGMGVNGGSSTTTGSGPGLSNGIGGGAASAPGQGGSNSVYGKGGDAGQITGSPGTGYGAGGGGSSTTGIGGGGTGGLIIIEEFGP